MQSRGSISDTLSLPAADLPSSGISREENSPVGVKCGNSDRCRDLHAQSKRRAVEDRVGPRDFRLLGMAFH